MSQVFSVRRVRHHGAHVYLGQDSQGEPVFSADPERIVRWLCDGYRFRFNQHRALRQKTVWTDDPDHPGQRIPLRDADGQKVLVTLGANPVKLTDAQARRQHPHLAAIPSLVLAHPERVENTEWWAAIKRRRTCRDRRLPAGAMPRFRSAKRGDLRFGVWYNGGRGATLQRTGRRSGVLSIRGQNPAGHRLPGQPATWRLCITVRLSVDVVPYTSVEVDWARRRVVLISPALSRQDPITGQAVGLDRGVVHAVTDSTGEHFDIPDTSAVQARRRRHQQAMARSRRVAQAQGRDWRTSRRRAEHRRLAAKASATIASVRKDFVEQLSHRIVSRFDVIGIEALDTRAMTRTACGTGFAAKRALNRRILDSGWAMLAERLQDKASRSPGKTVVQVPAAYTSQMCSQCGHTARQNRENQAVFRCQDCGHAQNADVNAAHNIRALALKGRAGPAGRGCQTDAGDAGPAVLGEPRTPALR